MANEIVKYESADGQEVTFTAQELKDRLCPNIEDKELALVMALCQAQKLNPFTKDVYIIKYGNSPASIVTSKEVFTKRAQANPKFEGMEAGVTFLTPKGEIVQREGSMPIVGWTLIGGWCKVYVKGYRVPIYDEVSLSEYSTGKNNWEKMPGTMVRKTAICHALREAFPAEFQGLYGAEEMGKVGEMVPDDQDMPSDGEKTASNDILEEVTTVEYEELASNEQMKALDAVAVRFAEACQKSLNEVVDATIGSQTMQELGAESWDALTPQQAIAATKLIENWIEKIASKTELI